MSNHVAFSITPKSLEELDSITSSRFLITSSHRERDCPFEHSLVPCTSHVVPRPFLIICTLLRPPPTSPDFPNPQAAGTHLSTTPSHPIPSHSILRKHPLLQTPAAETSKTRRKPVAARRPGLRNVAERPRPRAYSGSGVQNKAICLFVSV